MSSRGVPEVLMKKVDDYVDSLAPQIQPRITSELETFQRKTIDSLEDQVVDAFRSLFNKDKRGSSGGDSSRSPWSLNDAPPDSYGGQSLPFADELAKLSRSFTKITDEAGDDLRDIFDLTEGRGGGSSDTRSRGGDSGGDDFSRGAKKFLSSAINMVQDRLDDGGSGGGGQGFEFDGLLGVISNTVKDASRNPEEKARLISPEIKERVGAKLTQQHATIAEQFTRIALDHIKRWLRGNTTTRDLGDGVKGEIQDQVKDLVKGIGGLFSSSSRDDDQDQRTRSGGGGDRSRDGDDDESSGGGFSKVISDKLSTGIARVHREVRLEFRKILGGIEKQLFEMLPDEVQRPLEKILGGNPFDAQLDRDAGSTRDRGFGDNIKSKLLDKIRGLIRKVQETLRESILGVVNGGHRKFERESWVFVQSMVEQKVQKYLPKVKISVPDDIGNEGVSVGDPTTNAELGGHHPGPPPSQGGNYDRPPQGQQHDGGGQGYSQQQDYRPPADYQQQDSRPDYHQRQDYRPDDRSDGYPSSYQQQQQQQQDYRPQEYQSRQDYRNDSQQPPQGYQSQQYRPNDSRDDYQSQGQSYQGQGYQGQGYQGQGYQGQGYQGQDYQGQGYQGQNPRY